MPDVTFDFRLSSSYIQSFANLQRALSSRKPGNVIEIETKFLSGDLTLYMEAASLYIIGFQNASGQIMALEGDGQPFDKYLSDKYGKKSVSKSGINAKYGGDTWKLKILKDTLDQTLFLKTFIAGDTRLTTAKEHIDRMAFGIAEAARFVPIRCAIACVLHDDLKFLAVLERLSHYSQNLVLAERKAEPIEPGRTLSPRDLHARSVFPDANNIHIFEMKGNAFDGLSKTERWFRLLLAADKDLTPADRQRLLSLGNSHWFEMTLGDFQNLVKNWSKLSASQDPYIREIVAETHIRQTAGATPDDSTRFLLEWH